MRTRMLVGLTLVLSSAACTSGSTREERSAPDSSTAAGPTAQAAENCADAPALTPLEPFEVPTTNGQVTGLPFAPLPTRAGTEVKLVWRITGEGVPDIRALRPDGSAGRLAWGPSLHAESNFAAPGDEWGTGFRFDVPGCWVIELRRGDLQARLAIDVRP